MADIILPVPGENPNWGSKLNTAIIRINNELEALGVQVTVVSNNLSSVTVRVTNLEGRVTNLEAGLATQVQNLFSALIASDDTVINAATAAVEGALDDLRANFVPKDEAALTRYAVNFEDSNGKIFGGLYVDGTVEFLKLVVPDTGGGSGSITGISDITATKSYRSAWLAAGDSLTRGFGPGSTWPEANSWPSKLNAKLSGTTVSMGAVSGYTIDEVAILIGALGVRTPTGVTIPASGGVSFTIANTIGFRPSTSRSFTGRLAGISGTLSVSTDGTTATFTRSSDGASTPVNPGTEFRAGNSAWPRSVLILGAGRNDIATGVSGEHATVEDHVVERTRTIINWLEPKAPRFIVWGVPRSRSERPGTAARTTVDNINNRIKALYPTAWVDVPDWISSRAIYEVGASPTATDLQDIADGVPPESIMYDSIHWTEAVADKLADFMYEQASYREYRTDQ